MKVFILKMWTWIVGIPHRLAAIPESPHMIAKAFAVGVFIGLLPGPGAFVALAVAFFLRLSKVATLMGALVTNPWTAPFFYVASYKLGVMMIQLEEPVLWRDVLKFDANWHMEFFRAIVPLLIGSIALGTVAGVIGYGIVFVVVSQYRKARLRRRGDRDLRTESTAEIKNQKNRRRDDRG